MLIRPFLEADVQTIVELTVETFRPFYEDDLRQMMGETLLAHHHSQWEQDYRVDVPTLHNPAVGHYVAVAEIDGAIAGYVSWRPDELAGSSRVHILAVSSLHRRRQVGRNLCLHAIARMKADGIEFVGVGTGGEDNFHAPARALYASLGLTRIPVSLTLANLQGCVHPSIRLRTSEGRSQGGLRPLSWITNSRMWCCHLGIV